MSILFEKGEVCVLNEHGAEYLNRYAGGDYTSAGDEVVCQEDSDCPWCELVDNVYSGCCALDAEDMTSTGEYTHVED